MEKSRQGFAARVAGSAWLCMTDKVLLQGSRVGARVKCWLNQGVQCWCKDEGLVQGFQYVASRFTVFQEMPIDNQINWVKSQEYLER
jgi:hypothetical protein